VSFNLGHSIKFSALDSDYFLRTDEVTSTCCTKALFRILLKWKAMNECSQIFNLY